MGRLENRMKRKMEQNPITECNKIQNKYLPNLFKWFDKVADPRHQAYITYSVREMLGTMYYKAIGAVSSMRAMDRLSENEEVVQNLYSFMGKEARPFIPHSVTENEFLEKLKPEELEKIQKEIVYTMIRRKTFDEAKVFGKWLVIFDATELDEGNTQKNPAYLSRTYHRGETNEYTRYHRGVLEAKIYFGNDIVCSIGSETIENSEEYINKSRDDVKQDCESNAFKRLAKKIKDSFPRLPIIILADGLYVSQTVLEICENNGWDYIIRYKEGCASSIAKEYRSLPEKEVIDDDIEFQNDIMFQERDVNLVYYRERQKKSGNEVQTEFAWITNIRITKSNVKKIIKSGRLRWKIENQGFNRQKHWQGNIGHACSWNETAQKNHYLMEQIADFVKQLYEFFFLEKHGIKKPQKEISSELLASFGRQLTETEDISSEPPEAVPN